MRISDWSSDVCSSYLLSDPDDSASVCPLRDRASVLDAGISAVDGDHVQPVRLHHRHLGRWLREAADRAADDRHTTDLPRRQLLLDQHAAAAMRSEEHTSELQSLMRISYAVFCLKKKK